MRFNNSDNLEIQPGELREQITFSELVPVADGSGGHTETYQTILETRCSMRGVRGGETIEGGRDVSRNTVLIRIRRRGALAITAAHRAQILGVDYEVTSIQDRTGMRRTLWLECKSL